MVWQNDMDAKRLRYPLFVCIFTVEEMEEASVCYATLKIRACAWIPV